MQTNIIELLDYKRINTLLEGFNKTTGFVTAILDLKGNVLSKSGWRSICTEFHRVNAKTAERCTTSDTELANKMAEGEKYHFYKCLNGLVDVAVPLVINGEHIANLFSGQFFFEEPDRGIFLKQAAKYGFDNEEYMKALSNVPVISEERVKTAMDFLLDMTRMIAEITMQRIEQIYLNEEIQKKQVQLKAQNEELQKAKEKAEESEKYLNSILNNMGDPVFVKDDQSRIILANDAFCKLFELTRSQIIGKTLAEDVSPEERKNFSKIDKQVIANGIDNINIETLTVRNGQTLTISTRKTRFIDNSGNKFIVGAIRDITAQNQAELKLMESEERFREIIESSWDIHYRQNVITSEIDYISPAVTRVLGYTIDEMLAMQVEDHHKFFHADDLPNLKGFLNDLLIAEMKGDAKTERSFRMIHKSGEIRWINGSYFLTRDMQGQPKFVVGVLKDITERKHADKMLHDIIDKNPLSIQIIDKEGYTLQTNDAHTRLFGAVPPADYSIFKDKQIINQGFNEMFEGVIAGKSVQFPDFTFNIHDVYPELPDKPIWLRLVIFPLFDNSGKPDRYVLMHEDITERKHAEDALHESEERFKALHNASFGGIAIHNKGVILECNRGLTDLTGYSYEELIGMDGLLLIAETSRKMVFENIVAGYEKPYEATGLRKNGEEYPLRMEGRNIPYKGETVRTVEFRDITEQKQAEKTLKQSEETYRKLYENMPDGVYKTTHAGKILELNPAMIKMLGYNTLEEMLDLQINDKFYFDPNERERLTIAGMNKNIISYRLRKKDGTELWVEDNGWYTFNESGEIVQHEGIIRDITDRKRDEEKLIAALKLAEESEEKYKQIFDNTFDIMSIYEVTEDRRYKIITFNQAEAKLIGSVENYQGKYIDECISPELYEQFRPNYERCIKEDTRIEYEENISFLNVDKSFKTQLIPLKNAEGRIHRIIVISSDITDNKLLNNQLKINNEELKILNENLLAAKELAEESEAKFREMAELLPQIVFETDLAGNLTYLNKQAYKLSGYSEQDGLIGSSTLNFYIPEDRKRAVENIKLSLTGIKESPSNEYTMKRKDGTTFNVLVYSNPILKDNNPIGLRGIIVDISEIKQTEKELIEAKEHAEESDRLKSAFLANMSHEIRTPMNGILGFADLLKEPNLTGEVQQKYIGIIEKSGARMLNIINDIINISKIEAGLMTVNMQPTNINDQIEFIHTFFKPEVEGKGITFSFCNSLNNEKAIIKTDREKLYSILTNLVKNAIKFSQTGDIEFGYVLKADFLEFFVKDTGIGIPKDRQEAIFERFIQSDIHNKNAYQGAGLGLAISKAYVEMLGGKIWVESETGKGSCFYFTLPFSDPLKDQKNVESKNLATETTRDFNLKILIVEDDEASEMLVTVSVQNFAREIIYEKTGTGAVEACLKNQDIDLILMDIQLPGMDGYEATKQIREFNARVVIIAQTAFALQGDKKKALDAGCNDYISKPITKDELLKMIRKYFGK